MASLNRPDRTHMKPPFARSYVPIVTTQEQPQPVTRTEHLMQMIIAMLVMGAVVWYTCKP